MTTDLKALAEQILSVTYAGDPIATPLAKQFAAAYLDSEAALKDMIDDRNAETMSAAAWSKAYEEQLKEAINSRERADKAEAEVARYKRRLQEIGETVE